MKQILFLFLFLISSSGYSQDTTYFDVYGITVSKEEAAYYKVVTNIEKKLWKTQQFLISGKIEREGNSKKKNGSRKIGEHFTYDESGKVTWKGFYKRGNLATEEKYFKSNRLKSKTVYKEGLINTYHNYYDSGALKNEVFYFGKKGNRTITAKSYYNNGSLKRDAQYLEYFDLEKVGALKQYKLIQGKCFSEDGKEIEDTPYLRLASFYGGIKLFQLYLKNTVKYPEDAERERRQGLVLVGFVINENGEVEEPRIIKSGGIDFDKEAMRVIKEMPNWTPGILYGEPEKIYFTVPINFRLN